jgi:hypothetical protein
MRLSAPKIKVTPEMKVKQLKMRSFLRENKPIKFKELRPIGFQIDTSTIPKDKICEFLSIANMLKHDLITHL